MKVNDFNAKNIIITSDDFAISKGVDETVLELCKIGALNSVSSFVVTERFTSSIAKLKQTNVNIGLHLSLTFGKALTVTRHSLITDGNGNFNKSFVQILFLSFAKPTELQKIIEPEIKAQLATLMQHIASPSHIDGHQHIHTIPAVFEVVKKLQKEFNIPRVRIINEKFWQKYLFNPVNITGTIKLAILRLLGAWNGVKSDTYFISIFRTCKIDKNFIDNYKTPNGFKNVEIMLHTGNFNIDCDNLSKERNHLTSKWRNIETQFAKEFLNRENV